MLGVDDETVSASFLLSNIPSLRRVICCIYDNHYRRLRRIRRRSEPSSTRLPVVRGLMVVVPKYWRPLRSFGRPARFGSEARVVSSWNRSGRCSCLGEGPCRYTVSEGDDGEARGGEWTFPFIDKLEEAVRRASEAAPAQLSAWKVTHRA